MSLLARVVGQLEGLEVRFALIGAAAMAFHGASRATIDIDLLAVDRKALATASWSALESEGTEVEVRTGDQEDPLAGVVRFKSAGQRAVDLVVGKAAWQLEVIDRAIPRPSTPFGATRRTAGLRFSMRTGATLTIEIDPALPPAPP